MSSRTRYALAYQPTDGTPARTVRGMDEAGAAAAILEATVGQGIRSRDVGDALAGLAIGARESITVAVEGASLTVTLDRDAPSAEDARIAEDAAQWRRENGTASAADWAGAGDYVVTNAPEGERLYGLRRMTLEEATRVASFGRSAGFASRVERVGEGGYAAPIGAVVAHAPRLAGGASCLDCGLEATHAAHSVAPLEAAEPEPLAVGDRVRVALAGPSFGRTGTVAMLGDRPMLTMDDGAPVTGLILTDLVRLEASGVDAEQGATPAAGQAQTPHEGTEAARRFLASFGITLPSDAEIAAREDAHRATVQARLDAKHTASTLVAHVVSMRRLEATAAALVDALDSDYSSTEAERNSAAARLAIRADARQFAERVEAFVNRGEDLDGRRLDATDLDAWRPVLVGGASGTYAPSIVAAIRSTVQGGIVAAVAL